MSKNRLDACRNGDDFLHHALKHGATVRNGKGSHFIVSTSKGSCVVPVHPGDLGKGLRCKIIKIFISIGLAVTIVGAILCY